MKVMAKGTFSPDEVRNAVKLLVSEDAVLRSRAFAALQLPLQKAVPVQSSVRKIFNPIQLSAQEDAIFPLDTDDEVEVIKSSAYGTPPISMFMTDVVTVNTETYQSGWELPEQLAQAGRIDQVARNNARLLSGFISMEESAGWAVINAAVSGANTIALDSPVTDGTGIVDLVNEIVIYFQEKGYVPDQAWVSPRTMGLIRMLAKQSGLANEVRYDMWRNGMIQNLWGLDFYALRGLTDAGMYVFDTSRFGIMPIRQDMETREDPQARSQFKIRVYAQSQFAFCATSLDALAYGDITNSLTGT